MRPQNVLADAPMHEEQLAPILVHHGLPGRPVPDCETIDISWVPHEFRRII